MTGVVEITQTPEAQWNAWLAGLKPWELHKLIVSGNELAWHDDFVSGIVDLTELDCALQLYFDGLNPYGVKVP